MQRPRHRRPPTSLLLAAALTLLLRTLVPAGYMPAPLTSGWPVQICPDGLPLAAVEALLGQAHGHHHHGGDPASGDDTAMPEQCELGAGFAASAAVAGISLQIPAQRPSPARFIKPPAHTSLDELPAFRPRAPPKLPS